MTEISGLNPTDASNLAITGASIAEGGPPSAINDAIRNLAGALARDWQKKGPTLTAGGTANALTLTPTVALPAYVQGEVVSFIAANTNTGAVTLNISGLGTKAITKNGTVALAGGEIVAGAVVTVWYDGTRFQLGAATRGSLIGVQVFSTPGTATYTPTAGTNSVVAEVIGGGGGGGGCAATSGTQASGGSGGGAGGYACKRITSSFSGVTVTVGAKGSGGSAGANNGTGGGTSSFGALASATGGSGGQGSAAFTPPSTGIGETAGGTGSSGDINAQGMTGRHGYGLSTTAAIGGSGGSSLYGGGAQGLVTSGSSAGFGAPTGYGNGGGGAANAASQTAKAGGDGNAGIVIVWEYN
jgi:hypothetical protein